ncbi:MAG: ABC transporter substrate-binding protein, partial [Anaerovorax sp.]
TVILDYVPNTNHTGLYAALDLGYYKEQGLDVKIIEPADSTTPTLIAAGKGDFGISYQEDVTYALTAEEPLPIKAIATIIQHNTSGFASVKEKNILSPKDFEGKVYAGWGAPSEEAVIKAVMTSVGADPEKISIVTSDGSGYSVLKDKVDLMWIFWAWDGIASQMEGMDLNYTELRELDPRLDYYTPVIIANNDTIENNPEMVKKFMTATKKGYEYAIANPQDAAKVIHKYTPDYDIEMVTKSQEYLKDKYREGTEVWGVMKDEVWDGYTEFMVENGLIEKAIPAKDCYTNAFVE